jgi:hypothetical protein
MLDLICRWPMRGSVELGIYDGVVERGNHITACPATSTFVYGALLPIYQIAVLLLDFLFAPCNDAAHTWERLQGPQHVYFVAQLTAITSAAIFKPPTMRRAVASRMNMSTGQITDSSTLR